MKRSFQAAGVFAVLFGVSLGFAATWRDDLPDQDTLTLATHYPSVGRLDGASATDAWFGSGTLVASEWVLTAAHMTDGATDLQFTINGQTYTADRWKNYPKWNGDVAKGYDIALVHLSTSVTGVTPAVRFGKSNITGMVGTAVGYGDYGTGSTGTVGNDGALRATTNILEKSSLPGFSKSRLVLEDFDSPITPTASQLGGFIALPMEGIITPGDSGGGLFIDTASGPQLVGVNSFGFSEDGNPDGMYGEISGHARVSVFNGWINSTISRYDRAVLAHRTGKLNGYVLPLSHPGEAVSQPVPEPCGLALLLAGAVGILRRRRGGRKP